MRRPTITERIDRLEQRLAAIETEVDDNYQYVDERPRNDDGTIKLFCSFCSKGTDEVTDMIAGPSVFICNECVALCNEIIKENQEKRNGT